MIWQEPCGQSLAWLHRRPAAGPPTHCFAQGLSGDPELKRPPRGFDPDHAFIDDLRRKNFVTTVSFSEQEACAKDFATRFTRACRKGMPLAKFLASALDTPI